MQQQGERREAQRLPIELEVHYRLLSKRAKTVSGVGNTINISSSGALFTSNGLPPNGAEMEASIHWPVRLDNTHPLKLITRGRVVRVDELGRVAMRIEHYKFHTRSLSTSQGRHPEDQGNVNRPS